MYITLDDMRLIKYGGYNPPPTDDGGAPAYTKWEL